MTFGIMGNVYDLDMHSMYQGITFYGNLYSRDWNLGSVTRTVYMEWKMARL